MSPPSPARRPSRAAAKKVAPKRPFVAHHLSPPHEVLGEIESKKILETIGAPAERLPKILLTDPGLRADPKFEAMRESGENLLGRLVRIRRPSATAGQAVAYRVVVATTGGD